MTSNNTLISVIVPVYKSALYLDCCIKSIVNQTYQNLEVILVDDGSPDQSGVICDSWAIKDKRIIVVHQKNKGSAQARNVALDIAKGAYIAFVDSDDCISSDMISHLAEIIQNGADIAECEYLTFSSDPPVFPAVICAITNYNAEEALKLHLQDRLFRQLIWNKLYRRQILLGVRFPEGKKVDDEFFTYLALGNAKRMVHSSKVCYAYRQQVSSVMHSVKLEQRLQAIEAKMLRHAYILENYPSVKAYSLKSLWQACLYLEQLALKEQDKDIKKDATRLLKAVMRKYPINKEALDCCNGKQKVYIAMMHISFEGTCFFRNMMKIGL